jgi:hypothetical protein
MTARDQLATLNSPLPIERRPRMTLPFGAIIAGSRATFRGRAQGVVVDDGGAGLRFSSLGQTQQHAQVFRQGLKAAGLQPAPRLLGHDLCHRGRSLGIKRHGAPLRTM